MFNRVLVYQFNILPPFRRTEVDSALNLNVKSELDTSQFINGSIRLNGIEANRKEDYNIRFQFLLRDLDDFFKYKKVFFAEPSLLYFTAQAPNSGDGDNNVFFLWNYAECLSFQEEVKSDEPLGQDEILITAEFRTLTPYFYIDDTSQARYRDFSDPTKIRYDNGELYDSSIKYDQFEVNTTNFISSSNQATLNELFAWKKCNYESPLEIQEQWFRIYNEPRLYNYLTDTNRFSLWDLNSTVLNNYNSELSYTGNTDGVSIDIASTTAAYIGLDNNLAADGDVTFRVNIKAVSGTATHIRLYQENTTDGALFDSLKPINSGIPLGNDYYEHEFTRTATVSENTTVRVYPRTAADGAVSAGSDISIKDPSLFIASVVGENVPYQSKVQYQENYFTFQNSFNYVLDAYGLIFRVTSSPLDLQTTSESYKNKVRLDPLEQNQFIEVKNTNNNTGFRFIWLDPVDSPYILYDTSSGEVRNLLTSDLIPTDQGKFRIEIIGKSNLRFRALYQVNKILEEETADNLELKTDFISGTSLLTPNYNITIKNLLTFN